MCFFSFLLLTPADSSLLHLPAQVSHYHTRNGICCLVHNVYPHVAVMCTLWALLCISLVVLMRFPGLERATGVRSECRTFDIWSVDFSVAHGSKTTATWRKSSAYLIAGWCTFYAEFVFVTWKIWFCLHGLNKHMACTFKIKWKFHELTMNLPCSWCECGCFNV